MGSENICAHPRKSILRRIQYNEDRSAKVTDRCQMCGWNRVASRVDPDTMTANDMGPWLPRQPLRTPK